MSIRILEKALMETITLTRAELEKIIQETVMSILDKNKDAINQSVLEALEDTALSFAIEEGKTGIDADTDEIKKFLTSKISGKL